MATWPSNWAYVTLRAAGIDKSQFALNVMHAWMQSTPTEPWTNNPIGIPAQGSRVPAALNTKYAAFTTMTQFRASFAEKMKSGQGVNVAHTLNAADKYSDAWREIHALRWPGNDTESEYPSLLMDLVQAAYTDKVTARERPPPTTTGATHAPPDVHAAMRQQAVALHHAATHIAATSDAIAFIMTRG
jgi:hypothetical protein